MLNLHIAPADKTLLDSIKEAMKNENAVSDERCFHGMPPFSGEHNLLLELGYDLFRKNAVMRLANSVSETAVTLVKGREDFDQAFLGRSTLQALKKTNIIGGACQVTVPSQDYSMVVKDEAGWVPKDNSDFGAFWLEVRGRLQDTMAQTKNVKDHGLLFLNDVGRILPAKEKKVFVVMVENADELIAYNHSLLKKQAAKKRAAKGGDAAKVGLVADLPDEPSPFLKELERLTREADGAHIHFLLCCSSERVSESLHNTTGFRKGLIKVHTDTEEETSEGAGLFSVLSENDKLLDFYRSVRKKIVAEGTEEAARDGGGAGELEMLSDEILKKIVEGTKGSAAFVQDWAKLIANRNKTQADMEGYVAKFEEARTAGNSKRGAKNGGALDRKAVLKRMLFDSIDAELVMAEPKPEVVMLVQALLLSTDAFGGCFTAEELYLISDGNLELAEIHKAMTGYAITSMVSFKVEHRRKVYSIAPDFSDYLYDNFVKWPVGAYPRACLRVLEHLTVRLNDAAEVYHESVSRGVKRFDKLLKFMQLALAMDNSGMVRARPPRRGPSGPSNPPKDCLVVAQGDANETSCPSSCSSTDRAH